MVIFHPLMLTLNRRGTRKYSNEVPGYTGHIPESDEILAKMSDSRLDPSRLHSKEYLRITMNCNIPGYSGYRHHSVVNDRGEVKTTTLTTSGFNYR
jgi:hypothetical protein